MNIAIVLVLFRLYSFSLVTERDYLMVDSNSLESRGIDFCLSSLGYYLEDCVDYHYRQNLFASIKDESSDQWDAIFLKMDDLVSKYHLVQEQLTNGRYAKQLAEQMNYLKDLHNYDLQRYLLIVDIYNSLPDTFFKLAKERRSDDFMLRRFYFPLDTAMQHIRRLLNLESNLLNNYLTTGELLAAGQRPQLKFVIAEMDRRSAIIAESLIVIGSNIIDLFWEEAQRLSLSYGGGASRVLLDENDLVSPYDRFLASPGEGDRAYFYFIQDLASAFDALTTMKYQMSKIDKILNIRRVINGESEVSSSSLYRLAKDIFIETYFFKKYDGYYNYRDLKDNDEQNLPRILSWWGEGSDLRATLDKLNISFPPEDSDNFTVDPLPALL